MSARILGEGITITSALSSEEIVAHVDPNLVESVLLNLFINARDAMDGNGHLLISTAIETLTAAQAEAKELLPGKYIVISIQDNGRGIPADDIDKVIEPFYSTKPMEQGSGLGLSMAHGSVRQSKGTLEIDSTIGKGTTVKVLFPLQAKSGIESRTYLDDANNNVATKLIGENKRVLIVENDQMVRRQTVRFFSSLGFTVSDVGSALEARKLLKTQSDDIDLIFSDIVLPGESGYDLVKLVKTEYPNIAIHLATGLADDQILEIDNRQYLEDIVTIYKPYSKNDLEKSLRSLFRE
jgi:CheY-like chemotaxis protein